MVGNKRRAERHARVPSAEVGGDIRRNRALNCRPCVRSLIHSPDAVIQLTGCDGCGVADDGDDVTVPSRLGPHDAKAILDIMVRDSFDETGKNFMRLILGRVFQSLNSRDAGLNVAT
jgi:hypothetical protein